MIKPIEFFTYWTLDEVAECIGGLPRELYAKLWRLMPEDAPAQGEWPEPDSPDRDARSILAKWGEFEPAEQALLNELGAKYAM